jgi:hypothetical protein
VTEPEDESAGFRTEECLSIIAAESQLKHAYGAIS